MVSIFHVLFYNSLKKKKTPLKIKESEFNHTGIFTLLFYLVYEGEWYCPDFSFYSKMQIYLWDFSYIFSL